MGKFIIFMWLCSVTTTINCQQIKVDRVKFNDLYDCMNAGYNKSIEKMEEIGREEVNEHEAFVRFACVVSPKVET